MCYVNAFVCGHISACSCFLFACVCVFAILDIDFSKYVFAYVSMTCFCVYTYNCVYVHAFAGACECVLLVILFLWLCLYGAVCVWMCPCVRECINLLLLSRAGQHVKTARQKIAISRVVLPGLAMH